jgi:chemotaxis protein methyltransferase CheR
VSAARPVELGERFRDVLARQLGLAIEESRVEQMLELLDRCVARSGVDAQTYLARLEGPKAEEELCLLARELTVPETYFFRNAAQFDALRALLSAGHASAGNRRPQWLSAGCASGEEAYSLAIVGREVLPDREPSILALDVNPWILERARRGVFSAWSLRETSLGLQTRWFHPKKNREFALDDSIRESVTFVAGNLATDDAATAYPARFDVIFCRNVLMYFTPSKFQEAVGRLARALTPGGYLFLGTAETLRGISDDFELCQSHGAFYYRKKALAGVWTEEARRLKDAAAPAPSVQGSPAARLAPGLHWTDSIGRASARIDALSREPLQTGSPTPEPGAARDPERPFHSDLSVPLSLLRTEQFAEALAAVRALPARFAADPDALLLEAVLLTSQGEWSSAETSCRRLLELDELNAGAHYVLGLCGAGADRLDVATHHQRFAIYLDPHFAMPRLQLGLLLRRKGESSQARRELIQARALLERESASRLLMFGGGFGRAALLALCSAELAATGEGH